MNLKLMLSAVAAAALLASPATAKTRHASPQVPAQVETHGPAPQAVAPYGASVPVSARRSNNGLNADFQISGDK